MTPIDGAADPQPSDATTIEIAAAHWVAIRRNRQGWSGEQQAELDAWLAQSLAHRVAYVRIEATWRRTDRLAALHRPMRMTVGVPSERRALWFRAAVAFGFLAIGTGLFFGSEFVHSRGQIIETPRGGQEQITLADGSRIELNTDTAVRVDLTNGSRSVELLRGEAYFDIKHDASRPFVVGIPGRRIVDLGTKFAVRMTRQSVQIALLQGSARIEGKDARTSRGSVVLLPGDVAVATDTATHVTRHSDQDISERLAWQHGSIVFHNARLADAVAEFNRYGGTRLVVIGIAATRFKVNGTFLTTGSEEFAGVAQALFGLTTERRDGTITLSR